MKAAAYNAALALNNAAITMMKGACYEQGFQTLKDSMLLMREAQPPTSVDADAVVREKLHNSIHRTSNPEMSLSRIPLQVVSHDTADIFFEQQDKSSDDLVFTHSMIRFDTSDIALLDESQDHDYPCAIILHNIAIASLCTGRFDVGPKYLTFALQILESMFQVYSQNNDPYVLKRVVFVASTVLKTLVPTQIYRGEIDRARESAQQITFLSQIASKLESCGLFSCTFEPCAAVA
jgi:hypothetical protein